MTLELDNKEFQNVWNLVCSTNSSIFMTGRAGTGKSTFLRHIVENINKKTIVLAPTGIAAVNAGGVTLHSFFKIPLQPFALDDVNYSDARRMKAMQKFNNEKIKLLQEVELIVIDEVSMVRADVLDFIDRVLRTYVRGHRMEPFGGKQLLLVGDAFQLEPVVRNVDWDILRRFYVTPYFFGAQVFSQIKLIQVELKKVYRQKEADFLFLLDKVRIGNISTDDLNDINRRVDSNFSPSDAEMYITLTSTRATCDSINDQHITELPSPESIYEGRIVGDFPESSLPTNKMLTLKEGAQVIFVRNDKEHRWYNGTVGRIVACDEEDGVWVEVESDEVDEDGVRQNDCYFVEREIWENVKYRYDEKEHKVKSEVLGTFNQIPLKLAWAITIHKSQGLTFDRVIIDLSRGAFACGQVYVALSRCRTLSGIVLRSPITMADIKTNTYVRDFSAKANNQVLIDDQLEKARVSTLSVQAVKAFKEKDFRRAVDNALDAFTLSPDIMKMPSVRRYISFQLNVVNRLNEEIDRLLEQQQKQRDKNFEYAYEYYLMAVECFRKYDDLRAAKANLNKALGLSPDYADALSLRGEIEVEEGEFEQAIIDISTAMNGAKKPTQKVQMRLLRLRADAYIALHDWRNAFIDLEDVLRSPANRDKDTLKKMISVCTKRGLADDAEYYNQLLEDDDDD